MAKTKNEDTKIEIRAKGDSETLKELQAQPKSPVMLPITESLEPQMVVINGCIFAIPRGQLVQVPQSVYEIVQESLMKTMSAKNDIAVATKTL